MGVISTVVGTKVIEPLLDKGVERLADKIKSEIKSEYIKPYNVLGRYAFGYKFYATMRVYLRLFIGILIFLSLLGLFAGDFFVIIFTILVCVLVHFILKALYKKIGLLIWTEDYIYIEDKKSNIQFFEIDMLTRIYKKGRYICFVKNDEEYKTDIISGGIIDFLNFMNERKPEIISEIVQDERVMRDLYYFNNTL